MTTPKKTPRPAAKKTPAGPKKPQPKRSPKAKPKAAAKPRPKSPPDPKPAKTNPRPEPVRASAPPAGSTSAYEQFRDQQAAISRARSAKGREIGGIPDIIDIDRRERGGESFKLFCETYNPEAFSLGWSAVHLKVIRRIEEVVRHGDLFALAMERGGGKTTLCRMGVLWAVSYALRRYVKLIAANDDKGKESLATIRTFIRYLPLYALDFPEISYPAQQLAGIANRASGQTCCDESTMIEWAADRVVLPTVPPPSNWPKRWPLRADGKVPTSGIVVSESGLTGEGIRGSLHTLTTGELVRPDLVLLDDPQTPESARSPSQNATRLRLVSADVLGMAGPGQSIAAVMPCTVIERGDMVDQILDREKNPLWRGERSGILKAMPADLEAWDRYFEVYARCAQLTPKDFTESNDHYRARRVELDAGTEASWPDRKEPWEVSAVQSAMHLYFRDRRAFMAEYMNAPESDEPESASALQVDQVAAKATNVPRLVVPRSCTRLTAFIDVGAHVLWYMVAAWDERFSGAVIDYGAFPDQNRAYFTKADARPKLGTLPGVSNQSPEAAIYAGLTAVAARVMGRAYKQEESGAELRVEKCLADANWGPGTDMVYEFCRRSPHAALLVPSHGKYIGARSNPMSAWPDRAHERKGVLGWRLSPPSAGRGRHVVFDANKLKSFTADRIRTPAGAVGCLSLFDDGHDGHQMLADHWTAERPKELTDEKAGRTVDEWIELPNRDNDWFDCAVGCVLAASILGVAWTPDASGPAAKKQKRKIDLGAAYAAAKNAPPLTTVPR